MLLNLKAINAELAKRGFKATLAKGEGYFYFHGGVATDWLDRTVRVATLLASSLRTRARTGKPRSNKRFVIFAPR
jgi:hypothetical protein